MGGMSPKLWVGGASVAVLVPAAVAAATAADGTVTLGVGSGDMALLTASYNNMSDNYYTHLLNTYRKNMITLDSLRENIRKRLYFENNFNSLLTLGAPFLVSMKIPFKIKENGQQSH